MDDSSATAQLFLISSPTGWMIENNGMKVKLKLFQHISWKSISHYLSVNWYCFSHCLPLKQFLIFGLLLSFFKMDGFQASVQKYKSFHLVFQWYFPSISTNTSIHRTTKSVILAPWFAPPPVVPHPGPVWCGPVESVAPGVPGPGRYMEPLSQIELEKKFIEKSLVC